MTFHVGVSGFSYPKWAGTFYPKGTKSEEFLSYYSSRLGSVEINSSFYAPPGAAMVKGWTSRTAEDFRIAFKAPKTVTHVKRLGGEAVEAANRFSATLSLLGPRRGPILFQLPPYFKQDLNLLEGFLNQTADIESRVFEFRHESWLQGSTYRLLERHRTAFCIAETEDLAPTFRVTCGFAYFRLRKDSYDAKTIDQWGERIRVETKGLEEAYAYLRHDETGENALLAQRLNEGLRR